MHADDPPSCQTHTLDSEFTASRIAVVVEHIDCRIGAPGEENKFVVGRHRILGTFASLGVYLGKNATEKNYQKS
jgi:hypothetical protein